MPPSSPLVAQRTRTLSIAPVLLALAATAALPGQDVWSPMHGLGPFARDRHAMAYDSQRGGIVLFGGHDGTSATGETWQWDGSSWTRVATTGPSARASHAMAYDAARDRVVLFGGDDGNSTLGDTWEWDGSAWSTVAATGPAPRRGHAMTHDAVRGRIVLFGGHDGVSALGDTWEWDGVSWTQAALAGPLPRSAHALAYDALRDQVVLFGGADSATVLGDTWVWNGASWTLAATTGPAARSGHGMVFDGHRGRVVLFGGDSGAGAVAAETWTWDSTVWTPVAVTGPAPRSRHAMVHDALRRRVTLFGGHDGNVLGDTWTLSCAPWCDLGHGTAGTHGSPRLEGRGLLEGGRTLTLTLSNARSQSPAVLIAGTSSLHAPVLGGTIVPDPVVTLPMATNGTAGAPATVVLGPWTLPAGTPAGGTLYFQSWILDAAGPFGLAASNGLVGTTRRTLYDQISSSFDALLSKAAAPSSSLAIYSVQDFANLIFVRNPACWAAQIDLTGLSPWNQAHVNTRAGTLVSPRHVVFAKHYALSTTPGSNDIAFVTRQNATVLRKLVSVTYPAADIGVGLLDADVPPGIEFYRVLPGNWSDFLPQTNDLPMLHLDQEEKALVRDMDVVVSASTYCFHKTPADPTRRQFTETLISGDSGNPAFLLVNGEAILILTHHYATGGPFYTTHLNAVNAAMSQLGGGYQLTEADLSVVPR